MPAQQTIYVMESVNLICGDSVTNNAASGTTAAPGISTHLVLQELKLPGWEEAYVDHTPGGAQVGIEIPMHFNKLEATFNLAGWDPAIMAFMGQEEDKFHRFTAYGLIRDRRTSEALQALAVLEGRIGRVNPTAFSKGNLMSHEYSIKSIVSYYLAMQTSAEDPEPQTIFDWDFFTSSFQSGQTQLSDELGRLLAIPVNVNPAA